MAGPSERFVTEKTFFGSSFATMSAPSVRARNLSQFDRSRLLKRAIQFVDMAEGDCGSGAGLSAAKRLAANRMVRRRARAVVIILVRRMIAKTAAGNKESVRRL